MFILLALAGYFTLWPVAIEPVPWNAPAAPGYTGVHAANSRLAGLDNIHLRGESGPEHVVVGPDGRLYAAVLSGRILRMHPDGSGQEAFADTGGRPLGMVFDADGSLIVADALKGLLSVACDGAVAVLAAANCQATCFPNAVVASASGKIYFTDSSMRFTPAQWGGTMEAAMLDIFEQSATGRVLEYDPGTRTVRVVATGLSLANGIALSGDERSLFVSESGRYRVWKIDASADRIDVASSAQARVFLDNLPSYPDNLVRGLDGRIWLGLAGQRNELDSMAQRPFLRKVTLRVPRVLWPQPKGYGHVIAFTEDGQVVEDLQDPTGSSPTTTGATETRERLYIHNVDGAGIGWLPRPAK